MSVYGSKINNPRDVIYTYNNSIYELDNIYKRTLLSDYIFIGEVIKIDRIDSDLSKGDLIPYSFYKIKIHHVLKGELHKGTIEIVYFGAVIDDVLYQFGNYERSEKEHIPLINETYLFSAKELTKDYGRLKAGELVVYQPYSLISLPNYDGYYFNYPIVNDYVAAIETPSNNTIDGIGIDPGHGGGSIVNDGSSIDKAIIMNDGYETWDYMTETGQYKYYKIELYTSGGVHIDSNGPNPLNVKGTLLFSNQTKIISNNDIVGTLYSDDNFNKGFSLNTTLESGTYYIKVEKEISSEQGMYYMKYRFSESALRCNVDPNTYHNTYSSSVNENYEIVYKSLFTDYRSELSAAISDWNSVGVITIRRYNPLYDEAKDITLEFSKLEPLVPGSIGQWVRATSDYPVDNIRFSDSYLEHFDYYQRFRTLAHEIGHALGIYEMNGENNVNVMRQGSLGANSLGYCDKEVLRTRWD